MWKHRRVLLAVLAALAILAGVSAWRPHQRSSRLHAAPTRTRTTLPSLPAEASRWRPPEPTGMAGEYEHQAALLIGANELVQFHAQILGDVVAAAHESVRLICLVADDSQRAEVLAILNERGLSESAVEVVELPIMTMWVRDYGPLFSRFQGRSIIVDADTSSRSSTDFAPDGDDEAPRHLGRVLGVSVLGTPARIEGGNLLTNGDGLCVSTTNLLSANSGMGSEQSLESALAGPLGLRRWVYLRPLEDEPTGHVDMFVTFTGANLAVVGQMDPRKDPNNARILDEAAAALARETTSAGTIEVHRIPMPPAKDGVWRTYTNVVYANGVLLIPSYADVDANVEEAALAVYRKLLPGWRIVPVPCDSLIELGGALHCVMMNVPSFAPIPQPLDPQSIEPDPGARDLIAPGEPDPLRSHRREGSPGRLSQPGSPPTGRRRTQCPGDPD